MIRYTAVIIASWAKGMYHGDPSLGNGPHTPTGSYLYREYSLNSAYTTLLRPLSRGMSLNSSTSFVNEIDNQLRPFFDKPENGLAGAALMAVDKHGKTIYQGAFGTKSLDPERAGPMELDTMIWIGAFRCGLIMSSGLGYIHRVQRAL